MENKNKVLGGFKAGIIRRIKKSGLTGDDLKKALAAVTGIAQSTDTELKFSKAIRKTLFEAVQAHGPLVVTGRKMLKVFSLSGYERSRAASSANAIKHKPWRNSHKNSGVKKPAPAVDGSRLTAAVG